MMFRIFFPLFFLLLCIFQVLGRASSGCDLSEIPFTYLDLAVDMIGKAKLHFPVCPTISQKSRPMDCEKVDRLRPMDCEEVLHSGHNESGVYTIWPRNRILEEKSVDVFCDMDTDGGGWTVIQRRGNFSRPIDYFFKDWYSYKEGFGDIEKDFWLGNDNIYALSMQRLCSIRFDLKAVDGEKRYAVYDNFWIADEMDKYRLHVSDYSGDAGDSFKAHDKHQFTTKDQDNDKNEGNCAQMFKGGWWFYNCHHSNLNGMYYQGAHESSSDGVNWLTFTGQNEALDKTEMKIRSKDFLKKLVSIKALF